MLRINLLPPYIFDKQKKVKLAIVWGVAAAAVIGLLIMKNAAVAGDLDKAKKDLADATEAKTQYDNYETQINGVNTKVAVTRSKQTFIKDAKKSNDSWPVVYESMRDVTSPVILLQSLAVEATNHKALDFAGFAKDELTIARWWMTLRNAKDRFDSVSFNLPAHPYVPGGAQGGPGGFGMQGRFGGGAPGGMMGGRPMMSSSGSGMGGPMMSSSGGPGGSSMQAMMMARMGGRGGGFGGGGFGGGFGGGGNTANVGPTEIEGRPGLNFTGVALVKDTLAPPVAPTWPAGGGGGAGAGFGGFGGPGGMPPGMMGSGRMGGMPPGAGPAAAAPPPSSGGLNLGGKRGKGGDD